MAMIFLTLFLVPAAVYAFIPPFQQKGVFPPILGGAFPPIIKGGGFPFIPPIHKPGFIGAPLGFANQVPFIKLKKEKPMQLTCQELTTVTKEGVTVAGIAAVIKEKSDFGQQFGGHFGGPFFPGGGGLHGGFNKQRELKGDFKLIDPLNHQNAKVTLILTEKGYVGQYGCKTHNFGKGLQALSRSKIGGFNPYFNPHFGGGDRFTPQGVIEEFKLEPGTAKHVSLHDLKGYGNIEHLAGRGIIACTDVEVEYDGTAVCKNDYAIINCCTLAYDHEDRDLHISKYHK